MSANPDIWRLPELLKAAGVRSVPALQARLRKSGFRWSASRCWRLKAGDVSRLSLDDLNTLCVTFEINIFELIRLDGAQGLRMPRKSETGKTSVNVNPPAALKKNSLSMKTFGQQPVVFRPTIIPSRKRPELEPSRMQKSAPASKTAAELPTTRRRSRPEDAAHEHGALKTPNG